MLLMLLSKINIFVYASILDGVNLKNDVTITFH